MYLEHWGLKEFLYENVPDPRFFYLSHNHEEALSRLLYAVKMKKGGAMLSGDIGCGKTTLTKVCIQELSGDRYDISLIVNPKLEPLEFLQELVYQLGIPDVPDTKVKCLRVLNDRMTGSHPGCAEFSMVVQKKTVDSAGPVACGIDAPFHGA